MHGEMARAVPTSWCGVSNPDIEHLRKGQRLHRVRLRRHITEPPPVRISCLRSSQGFDIALLGDVLVICADMLEIVVASDGQEDEPDEGVSPSQALPRESEVIS